jgi:transposase-like protein
MSDNLEILNAAVSLLIRAALLAARFSGRVRQRSLNRLASREVDAKAKEILFLKDRVYQLEMQVSILQKHLGKKGQSPRYTVRERLLILWHIEAFQIPRRRVSRCFGIARSTLYRWLHQIEDEKSSAPAANKTPAESHPFRTPSCGEFRRFKAVPHPLDRHRKCRLRMIRHREAGKPVSSFQAEPVAPRAAAVVPWDTMSARDVLARDVLQGSCP